MSLQIESPAEDSAGKNGDGPEQQSAPVETGVAGLPGRVRWLLLSCLTVNAVVVLWLAVWDATLTRSAWDLLGAALLLGIGITCALAIGAILRRSSSAFLTAMTSQIFVVCLAAYVWLVDERSPVRQLIGVAGVALAFGAIALFWVVYLARYAHGAINRGAVVVVALFPVLGLVQFWLQSDYLPARSLPLVDVQAELTPMGSSGSIIHLSAKVTMHNRSSVAVDIPGGVMRVTAYPFGVPEEPATGETVASHLNPVGTLLGDYRQVPVSPGDAKLLFAGTIGAAGSFLTPGSTTTGQVMIDIDPRTVRLAQMRASIIAVTHRAVQDTRTCYEPKKSYNADIAGYLNEAGVLHDWPGGKALCTETQFAARGAIEDLVADHPVLRIFNVVDHKMFTTPLLVPLLGTGSSVEDPEAGMDEAATIETATPSGMFGANAEYAPADSDLHH
ncbi:hypothetical protein [Mycolicibacterium porcinum]|uniref:MFS transporter n=2 Tax=Mycolicibacterium porcinum TaxID=39693 RepID=A0AAW5T3G9_9MYCO|nr:hypothetical protein [Mycolicibacterium porcinum]MCV7389380.1 hypothetical protein [Mycolicibacterium porcinum]ORB44878.1 hypothetical protein BST41_03060 [Mycolicibacterium porcinum]CDO27706.1 hypothetical protein BN979_00482 [Mycolicibacterium vulneris]